MTQTVLVIINKDEGSLGSSETFLQAHIEGLPCNVIALVGNPGYRRFIENNNQYLQSRAIIPLGLRWAIRKMGVSTVAKQDRLAVSRFLKRNRISAVLAEYGNTAVSVMDACTDAGVPLIAQFHGWDAYSKYMLNENQEGYRQLFEQASAVVAVSKHMRDQLLKLGAKSGNTFHNSCGADLPEGLKVDPKLTEKKFLMVGRLTEKKAPLLSILAFAQVAMHHKDATMDIIGDGPLRHACEQLSKGLGLSAKVSFHGIQSHKEVINFMARSRCFVQHSVTAFDGDHEGTPVSVLEAMGMGLPVVSTRHGGIMDVIESGSSGSLVNEYDVKNMAQEMIKYADDAMLAQQVGENARAAVLANWTNDKSNGRLWNIIDKAINK